MTIGKRDAPDAADMTDLTNGGEDTVFVEAPARLHFGMLDLRGALGRRFGGIGVAIPTPSLLLQASAADTLHAEGPSAARAEEFARRFMEHHKLEGGARIRVHRAIPSHAGLGSGTQLALGVARALAELYSLPTAAPLLALAVGRARRSAIGTWIFAQGGFVLEGGRRKGSRDPAPLLARYELPSDWRYVVALPPGKEGVSGEKEAAVMTGYHGADNVPCRRGCVEAHRRERCRAAVAVAFDQHVMRRPDLPGKVTGEGLRPDQAAA